MSLGAEDRIHQWLRQKLRDQGHDRIGDDAAILPAEGPWSVTQDHQNEGVHFPAGLPPALIGRRLLAVNLSDLASMGAEPAYAFLAVSCPEDYDVRGLLSGLLTAARRHGVELAGGDLSRSRTLTTSLTLIGRRPPRGRWLRRSHGRPGDRLWIAGNLGLSALGRWLLASGTTVAGRSIRLPASLRLGRSEERLARRAVRCHLEPTPQLAVGRWLARRQRAAAIDVSDGLAIDLHRLCRESATGARLQLDRLAIPRGLPSLCSRLDRQLDDLILAGGEDYALLFAVPPRVVPSAELGCQRIGTLTAESAVVLESPSGDRELPAAGWDHFDRRRR